MLARIAALMRDPGLREAILKASSAADIHELQMEAEEAYLTRQRSRADVHWPAGVC